MVFPAVGSVAGDEMYFRFSSACECAGREGHMHPAAVVCNAGFTKSRTLGPRVGPYSLCFGFRFPDKPL